MGLRVNAILKGVFDIEAQDRLKVFFLCIAFFFIIGAYTIAKELKDIVFISIVGREYIPLAKIPAMLILLPAILLYSLLVDRMRRYRLFSFYSAFFGVMGLVFAYFIGHPSIGLANTDAGPYRLFGWLFYCFVEGYTPFVVSVFWAFANSISSPDSAKRYYGLLASSSKLGGMVTSGLAWALFSLGSSALPGGFSDIAIHQIVLVVSSLLLLVVPMVIFLLMKKVPGRYLHGYEAVYQVEKQKKKLKQEKTGVFVGLAMLVKHPYVLGIFGMIYFYEVIATILSYLRLGIAQSNAATVSDVSAFLFKMVFMTHAIGFLISLFVTQTLLKRFGERICLLLIPALSGALLL